MENYPQQMPPTGGIQQLESPVSLPNPTGDHDRMSHIILEGLQPSEGEYIKIQPNVVESMVNGVPVTSLCGKVWVPKHDASKYPRCPTCDEIAKSEGWKTPA